jgi:hypothetical protein
MLRLPCLAAGGFLFLEAAVVKNEREQPLAYPKCEDHPYMNPNTSVYD